MKEKAFFTFFEASLALCAELTFCQVFSEEGDSVDMSHVSPRLIELAETRRSSYKVLGPFVENLPLSDIDTVTLDPSNAEGRVRTVQTITDFNQVLEQKISLDDPALIYVIMGSSIGVLHGSVPWAKLETKKKPYVQGMAQFIAEYSNKIPDEFRDVMAELAKLDGKRMTPDIVPTIEEKIAYIDTKMKL